MYSWYKNIASWKIKNTLYLSIVFTWDLKEACSIAEKWLEKKSKKVIAGGPAVKAMPDFLPDIITIQDETIFPALSFHNPLATFTTRGCPNKCAFCIVPKIEGELTELDGWPVRPIVCDNNMLGSSMQHFKYSINRLKVLPFVDFNQGLDARKFTDEHAYLISTLRSSKVRFAFDSPEQEQPLRDALALSRNAGLKDIGVYVLINNDENPDEALYRLETVRGLGAVPFPMRYQPLYALEYNKHISDIWLNYYGSSTKARTELSRMVRYFSRLNWFSGIPFDEFQWKENERHQGELTYD